jgi:serine/threonine-protein kinase
MGRGRLVRIASRIAVVVAGAVVVLVVGTLSFELALRWQRRTMTVGVPNLAGLRRAEAEQVAARAGLRFEVAGERYDPSVPAGSVLVQTPTAGALVRRDRKVRVVLSLGQQALRVPDVTGMPAREAAVRIEREGLELGDEAHVRSWSAPEGVVLAQSPPPGSPAVSPTRVHRIVSLGPDPPRFVMPDLTGLTLGTATRWIEAMGFRRGPVRRVPSEAAAPNAIVGQWPLAGYPVRPRAVIELAVSS